MSQKVYDQHRSAFSSVSAWVILKDGQPVANVAAKWGNACTAYTHWLGVEMTRGQAGGGGYDRESAAIQGGFAKASAVTPEKDRRDWQDTPDYRERERAAQAELDAFRAALNSRGGFHWYQNLEEAGYRVVRAV